MLLALYRPERDDDEQVGAAMRGRAEDFGEAEVVANKGRDGEIVPRECDNLDARFVRFRFAAECERVNLGVAGEELSFGRVGDGFIAAQMRRTWAHDTADDKGLIGPGELRKELLVLTIGT